MGKKGANIVLGLLALLLLAGIAQTALGLLMKLVLGVLAALLPLVVLCAIGLFVMHRYLDPRHRRMVFGGIGKVIKMMGSRATKVAVAKAKAAGYERGLKDGEAKAKEKSAYERGFAEGKRAAKATP